MKKGLVGALFLLLIFCVAGCSSASETTPTAIPTVSPTPTAVTESAKMIDAIVSLQDEGLSFDSGNYSKGQIPPGEYIFISLGESGRYYSEQDMSGSIIDNQNFASFGYVTVQGVGNVMSTGCLVSVNALGKLGASGAKDIYEKMYGMKNYNQSGYYKVGVDIPEGVHTLNSLGGKGYYALLSGPVGNKEIISNENFNGAIDVEMTAGQYLELNRASFD